MVVAGMAAAGMAGADPIDEAAARKMLFARKGHAVALAEDTGLSELHMSFVKLLIVDPEFKRAARYYGAMALSPSVFEVTAAEGITDRARSLVKFVGNYHSPAAADLAARSACDAARGRADAPCVVVARILPKRWKPDRALTLSQAATVNFRPYAKAKAPKAFAVSPGSPGFGLADGETAAETALATCNAQAARLGDPDCIVAIAD